MTLFAQASEAGSLFHIALHDKCNNAPDAMTLQLLNA